MIRRVDDDGDGALSVDPVSPVGSSGDEERERMEAVERAVRRVLEIVPGERRLLPEFGCRIHALGSFRTARDRALAAGLVEDALERWVPDLEIDRAEVSPATDGWIRVALRIAGRRHELQIKHRGRGAGSSEPLPSVKSPDRSREEPAV